MDIDSSQTLEEGESSSPLGPSLHCGEELGEPLIMVSPVASPQEALIADPSLPKEEEEESGTVPEAAAESQLTEAEGWLPEPMESSSSTQPLLLTYRPPENNLSRYRWNQPWENLNGFSHREPSENLKPWESPNGFSPRVVPSGVGAGLINLGLTCFANAVLQCFTHTVPLVESLHSSDHPNPCDRAREGFCLVCVLRGHIEASLDSSGGSISPTEFIDNLNHIASYFQRHQQEDAHEFQQAMLDKLERCCLDQKKDSGSPSPKNIVDEVFGGRLVSKLQCCNCGHCSRTYEPLIDLSLEIEHIQTLSSALESFTNVEKMDDPDSKFRCENCDEDVSVEKQLLVEKAPTIAAFHLKRFKSDGLSVEKIDKHVPFPLELDLQPFTSCHESDDVQLKYQLYAIVVHTGRSPTWGHYFSFVRSFPGIWHKFDDSKVVRVHEEFVLSQDAYILFYAKQGTPWFLTLMEDWKAKSDLISETSPKSVLDKVDTPYPLYPTFSNSESSTCHVTAGNFSGISAPEFALDKVHSPCTTHTGFSNFESCTFTGTAGNALGTADPLCSENCIDMEVNETRVDDDGSDECREEVNFLESLFVDEKQGNVAASNGIYRCNNETRVDDDGSNECRVENKFAESLFVDGEKGTATTPNGIDRCSNELVELEMDENLHPRTPPESPFPESLHNIRGKKPSESSSRHTTVQHQRKTERSSCRKQLSKSLDDPKKREALRCIRKMPGARASQLLSALHGPRSPGSKKKVARRRAGASYCERTSPSSARHRSSSDQRILTPPIL